MIDSGAVNSGSCLLPPCTLPPPSHAHSAGRLKAEPAVSRGQAVTCFSKVTPGKAGSTSVALTYPQPSGTLVAPDAGREALAWRPAALLLQFAISAARGQRKHGWNMLWDLSTEVHHLESVCLTVAVYHVLITAIKV